MLCPGGEQPFVGGTSAVRDNYATGTKKAAGELGHRNGEAQQEHATAVLNTHKSHRHPSGTNPGSLENNFELILKGEEKFPFSNYCNERRVAVLVRLFRTALSTVDNTLSELKRIAYNFKHTALVLGVRVAAKPINSSKFLTGV